MTEKNRVEELEDGLREAAEALDSVWAAIGDALCSGRGIVKEYSQHVASDAHAAMKRARALVGWQPSAKERGRRGELPPAAKPRDAKRDPSASDPRDEIARAAIVTFAQVYRMASSHDPEVRDAIWKMAGIVADDGVDADARVAAMETIVEALFPSESVDL